MRASWGRNLGRVRTRQGTVLIAVLPVIISMGIATQAAAAHRARSSVVALTSAPTSPTDSTKVPHYFGPYPNWANSPLTQSTATITFNDPSGLGAGAEAVAQVDPQTGGITGIDVTSPGHDYGQSTAVVIGGGAGATATPAITTSGAVVSLSVTAAGSHYTSFHVAVTGGGGTGAAVSATGGVDSVAIVDGGTAYTMPTVDFDLPADPNGTQARGHVPMKANGDAVDGMNAQGTVTAVVIDDPGSGYTQAPDVAIHNGTLMDPISGATPATVTSTLKLSGLTVDDIGTGYTGSPTVTVTDPTGTGTGATAHAVTDSGAVGGISVDNAGSGYLSAGIKKFQDDLPLTCDPKLDGTGCPAAPATPAMGAANKFIPLGVPESVTYSGQQADQYVIGLVQYRTKFSSDLPATLVRGYVQLSTAAVPGQHVPLFNELMNGTKQATGYFGVTSPQWLGPIVTATKDRPVRVVFRNLLPTGSGGDLFLPTDSSMMGSGLTPTTSTDPTNARHRAGQGPQPRLHPVPEAQQLLQGQPGHAAPARRHDAVDQRRHAAPVDHARGRDHRVAAGRQRPERPGHARRRRPAGVPDCSATDDGCSTFFYTNQQSARMMFYHDHSWGITRLNVYAGEAAGYNDHRQRPRRS